MYPRLIADRIPAVVIAVATVYLLAVAVSTWRTVHTVAPVAVHAVTSTVPMTAPPHELAALADAPLFGRYAPLPVKPAAPPPTALALTLHAVFVSPHRPEASFAVIGEAGARPRAFALHDPLPGGAVLVEVGADRVVLLRDGHYETLLFKHAASAR
jgi:general secretion pathway protein C